MKKRYCELSELASIILEAIGNADFAGVDNPNSDFQRGAYWGNVLGYDEDKHRS